MGAGRIGTHVREALKLRALFSRDDLVQQHALGTVQLLLSQAHLQFTMRLRYASRTSPPPPGQYIIR